MERLKQLFPSACVLAPILEIVMTVKWVAEGEMCQHLKIHDHKCYFLQTL